MFGIVGKVRQLARDARLLVRYADHLDGCGYRDGRRCSCGRDVLVRRIERESARFVDL